MMMNMLMMGGSPGAVNDNLPDTSSNFGIAVYSVGNDGVLAYNSGSSTVNWVTPANASVAAFYQVSVHVNSGSLSGPTPDTWHDCSTTRAWGINPIGTANFDISIREKATGIVRSTQNVNMTAAG